MISQEDYDRFKRSNVTPNRKRDTPSRTGVRLNTIATKEEAPISDLPKNTEPNSTILVPSDIQTNQVRRFKKRYLAAPLLIMVIIAAVIVFRSNKIVSPIPNKYSSSVGFAVYYPQSSKLPKGYFLNTSSFKLPAKDVLVYSIDNSQNQHLDISLQAKPSKSNLNEFVKQHLALNTSLRTSVGTATIGVINDQTVVSLPTPTTTWIIVTSPLSIPQSQLNEVLLSLRD